MTEEKTVKLNEIAEMIPEVSKAKTNAFTTSLNTQANLDLDKVNLSLITDFSKYIYKNISDLCQAMFLYNSL